MKLCLRNNIIYILFNYPLYILNKQNLSPGVFQRLGLLTIRFIELLAIIIGRNYNMDNYLRPSYQPPRKYFICSTYFVAYTRIIPFLFATFINPLIQKVFNQKNQGLYYTNYNYNKQTYDYISYYVKKSVV